MVFGGSVFYAQKSSPPSCRSFPPVCPEISPNFFNLDLCPSGVPPWYILKYFAMKRGAQSKISLFFTFFLRVWLSLYILISSFVLWG